MSSAVSAMHHDRFAPGLLARLDPPPRKVALVRASRIGDFVCATPALRALRRALPGAEITLIALPLVRALAARNTAIDRHAPFPGWPGIAEQFYRPERAHRFLARMRKYPFDLAIQMHGTGVFANPFTRALGARVNAGFVRTQDGDGALDAALPMPPGHEVQRLLALARFIGANTEGCELEFPLYAGDGARANALLASATAPLIGLHGDARDATRRWPQASFRAVARKLQMRTGGTVVLLGARVAECDDEFLDLRGRTSLPVLGAVLARLSVFITNDSGPAHLAYALGVPSVTVFGATDPAQWGPPLNARHRVVSVPIDCRPCAHAQCPIGQPCLNGIGPDEVLQAAEAVMHRKYCADR